MSGKNKKILIITPYFYPEDFPLNNFVKELSTKEYDIKVLTGLPNYRNFSFYKKYSIFGPYREKFYSSKIQRVPVFPRLNNSFISILIFYLSFFISSFCFIIIYAIISRNKYHHVISFCGSPVYVGYLGTIFSKISNCKSSQWIQDIWPEAIISSFNIKKNNVFLKAVDYLQTKMWNSADIIVSQSELLNQYFNRNYLNFKTVYINNPSRETTDDNNKFNIHLNSKKKIITYFGNVGNTQNIELIIDLLKNEDIIINICGIGSLLDLLKKKYSSYSNIIFHGWLNQKEMKTIAQKTDFFYLSLKNQGRQKYIFPSKFQTYLNYSKPIIFIGDSAFCHLIEINKLGFALNINEIQNPKILIENINKFNMNDKILFTKSTKKYFDENFNLNNIVKKFCRDVLND